MRSLTVFIASARKQQWGSCAGEERREATAIRFRRFFAELPRRKANPGKRAPSDSGQQIPSGVYTGGSPGRQGISFDCAFLFPQTRVGCIASAKHGLAIFLQAFVAASIFFVWVLRHSRVPDEFKQDKLPNCRVPKWLRDFLAILKITGAILLLIGIDRPRAGIGGGLMIAVLMVAAVFTHFRAKNPPLKVLLAVTLLLCSLIVAYLNYRLYFSI
jgi:hypothetical protein